MICTFHKCYEMNYSINSWNQIIIAKAKEKVLKTKLKTRSRFSNDSKTGLAWRDDRTSGWQLDWSGNDFMPRLMSTPAGVCCGSSAAGRGHTVQGLQGAWCRGGGITATWQWGCIGRMENTLCLLSSKCWHCAFFLVHCLLHALLQRALWCYSTAMITMDDAYYI